LLGVVSNYLLRMDVPLGIIADMMSIQEWLIAECGAMTRQEDDDWRQLDLKKYVYKNIETLEEAYLNILKEKRVTISKCEYRKLSRERMRLVKDSPL
jgi:hypothetical protein